MIYVIQIVLFHFGQSKSPLLNGYPEIGFRMNEIYSLMESHCKFQWTKLTTCAATKKWSHLRWSVSRDIICYVTKCYQIEVFNIMEEIYLNCVFYICLQWNWKPCPSRQRRVNKTQVYETHIDVAGGYVRYLQIQSSKGQMQIHSFTHWGSLYM